MTVTLPDTLPALSKDERDRINRALIAKLAALLGWNPDMSVVRAIFDVVSENQ